MLHGHGTLVGHPATDHDQSRPRAAQFPTDASFLLSIKKLKVSGLAGGNHGGGVFPLGAQHACGIPRASHDRFVGGQAVFTDRQGHGQRHGWTRRASGIAIGGHRNGAPAIHDAAAIGKPIVNVQSADWEHHPNG